MRLTFVFGYFFTYFDDRKYLAGYNNSEFGSFNSLQRCRFPGACFQLSTENCTNYRIIKVYIVNELGHVDMF